MDEQDVAQAWANYLETGGVDAMEVLVRHYEPLAKYLTRRALARAPAYQNREDILSYAHHGLIDAIQRFRPDVGVKFETYATRRIAGAIIDGQRQQDPLARSARKRVKLMDLAIAELWEELDADPSLEAIADRMGESVEVVKATMLARKSLHGSLDADNGVADHLGHGGDQEVTAQLNEVRSSMASRLALLSARERAFVLTYYCEKQNLKAAAESLGQSNDWCRQTRGNILSLIGASNSH